MSAIVDAIAALDMIDRIEGVVSGFLNADWRGAYSRGGAAGLVAELGRTATGSNRWRFSVPRDCEWNGAEVERFLRHYGVAVWDRGFDANDLHFSVKKRQANWAEYLLLRRGVPLSGPLFNAQNAVYGAHHAPGDRPPAWEDRSRRRGIVDDLLDLF